MEWKCRVCGEACDLPRIACAKCGAFSDNAVQGLRIEMFQEYEALEVGEDAFAKPAAPKLEPVVGETRSESYWMCWHCKRQLKGQGWCPRCGLGAAFILGRSDGATPGSIAEQGRRQAAGVGRMR